MTLVALRRMQLAVSLLLTTVIGASFAASVSARDAEAIAGEPFGVGRVTVPMAPGSGEFQNEAIFLRERSGRVLYPAATTGRVRQVLGQVLGQQANGSADEVTVYFLFRGNEPLDLTVEADRSHRLRVEPSREATGSFRRRQASRIERRLLMQWWRTYNANIRQQVSEGDYPPIVQNYLATMLARRLGLQAPLLNRIGQQDQDDQAMETLELLAGVERLKMQTLRETMLGEGLGEESGSTADRAVPSDPHWTELELPTLPDVEVEPIAMHVPAECFYVRFGTFSNYLWLSHLLEDYGGDIGRMVTLRGFQPGLNERMQQRLILRQSALADMLGDHVVADVAILGRDMYSQEGAAIGMLFEARQPLILGRDIGQQRARALKEIPEAQEEKLEIEGRTVSFISTPDQRLRSFYAVDGNYHLVTTSRAIVKRFFQAGKGEAPLGATQEFQHARSAYPLTRDDTIFVYLSSKFFQGLVSPQYQVELHRRLQAVADLELYQMAQLAAQNEQLPSDNIRALVEAGLLPPGFGVRPDGSRLVESGGQVINSLRGARGNFIPIPDVPIEAVTPEEEARYVARANYYQANWKQLDPLMASVRRVPLDEKGLERLEIDARIAPLDEGKYGWLVESLGPPTNTRVAASEGDIISVQAVMQGFGFLQAPVHHLFLGIQDNVPQTDLRPTGLLKTLQILQTTPGYIGAWPKPGFLDLLPFGLGGGEPDAFGYSALPFGLWRRQWEAFSVLSFDRLLLDFVTPQLHVVEVDDPAQIRVHVGDLSQAKISTLVNALNFTRAQQASVGNTRLLHLLVQQFGVAPHDAKPTAERLVDAKLVCTLGGEYELKEFGETSRWVSTAWPGGPREVVPAEYQAPLLGWFRGLDAGLTKFGDRVVVHADLVLYRKPSSGGGTFGLPLLNLFGNSKAEAAEEVEPQEEPPKPTTPDGPREF